MAMPLSLASTQHKATFLDILKASRSLTPYKTLRYHTMSRNLDAFPRSSAISVHLEAPGYAEATLSGSRMKIDTRSDTFENSGPQKPHLPATTTTLLNRSLLDLKILHLCPLPCSDPERLHNSQTLTHLPIMLENTCLGRLEVRNLPKSSPLATTEPT